MPDSDQRREIDLPAGRIRYREAGEGTPVVFVHGYLVDGRLWDGVVDRLSATHRCLAPGLADRRPADRDEARRRPHPLWDRRHDRRLPRGARPRRRDDRRQRLRRGDVAGPRHPPPGADRPPRPDKLRHPRELPAGDLQGDAEDRCAARWNGGPRRPVPDRRPRPRRLPSLHPRSPARRPDRLLDEARAERPRRQTRRQEGDRRDEQALHARGGGEAERAPSCRSCWRGRPATASSRSSTPSAWPPTPPTPVSPRSPTRRPSSPSTSRSGSPTRSRRSSAPRREKPAQRCGVQSSRRAFFSSDRRLHSL